MRIQWLLGVASGMSQLHALLPKSIIHRDLKSANVLLSPDLREAKITDFGVAITAETMNSALSAASSGGGAGTLAFKSPETFDGNYSEKSDVYAMGVTAYEVLTREQPYEGLSQPEVLDRSRQRFIFDQVSFEEDGVSEARQRERWNKKHPLIHRRPDLDKTEEGCPASLIAWMVHCWADHANNRPTFEESVLFLQKLLEGRQTVPSNWLSDQTTTTPSKPFEVVRVQDPRVLESLTSMMQGNHIGTGGRDHQGSTNYTQIKMEGAWRLENRAQWHKYTSQRADVKSIIMQMSSEQRGRLPNPNLRAALIQAGKELTECGELYEPIVNEAHLFHGLGDAQVVTNIAARGFNEHLAGANAGTLFGDGIYMAEDVGKCDQYCRPADTSVQQQLNASVFGSDTDDLQGKSLRYLFVCRVTLGCIIQVGQDRAHRLGTQEQVFSVNRGTQNKRELALMPQYLIDGPTHYHTELAEVCPGPMVADDTHKEALGNQLRFREFIAFRDTLIYPEYLIAYSRE